MFLKGQDNTFNYPSESVQVFSDRNLYITGETILFSAIVFNDSNLPGQFQSKVLNVELISPDGKRMAAGKYALENSSAEGCLPIPGDLITGNYYLKSYTRWMRNESLGNYSFILLKIINPYIAELADNEHADNSSNGIITGQPKNNILDGGITLVTAKEFYHPGENVELQVDNSIFSGIPARKVCIAVVPAATWDSIPRDSIPRDSIPRDSIPDIQYYPETRGISLSGRLLEEETKNPVPNGLVNISVIGDKNVMAIRTNEKGQFYFTLPGYTGNRDIFLCGEDSPGKKTDIFIENDFCTRPVNLPSPVFHLDSAEKQAALKMAVNQKITSVFFKDTATGKAISQPSSLPFYNKPDEILVMDKYIDLPTMEDYFSELLGNVNVKKFEGRKIFRFNSPRTEMTIYDPLVLIDWVAVSDINKILAMSPGMIERIELVNAPYIKGSITYGGIISFFSKKNDFAGIDLPSSGTFINYAFYEDCRPAFPPAELKPNLPDARNTVYWDPDLQFDTRNRAILHFTLPDTQGTYSIVVNWVDRSGKRFCTKKDITVTNR